MERTVDSLRIEIQQLKDKLEESKRLLKESENARHLQEQFIQMHMLNQQSNIGQNRRPSQSIGKDNYAYKDMSGANNA